MGCDLCLPLIAMDLGEVSKYNVRGTILRIEYCSDHDPLWPASASTSTPSSWSTPFSWSTPSSGFLFSSQNKVVVCSVLRRNYTLDIFQVAFLCDSGGAEERIRLNFTSGLGMPVSWRRSRVCKS